MKANGFVFDVISGIENTVYGWAKHVDMQTLSKHLAAAGRHKEQGRAASAHDPGPATPPAQAHAPTDGSPVTLCI